MSAGAVTPMRTPSRPTRRMRTSMPSPIMIASLSLRVKTSMASVYRQRMIQRVRAGGRNDLNAEHPARVDDQGGAQIDGRAIAVGGHGAQPQQRFVVSGVDPLAVRGVERLRVRVEHQPRVDG